MNRSPNIVRERNPIHALQRTIAKRAIVSKVTRSLTGKMEDLKGLTGLMNTEVGTPGLQSFLNQLMHDIEQQRGMAALFANVGSWVNAEGKRKLIENFICNWAYIGQRARMKASTFDTWIPSFMVISPTMHCNLNCTGCYSGLYTKDGTLSESEIDDLLKQARGLGMYFVVISGGEPYLLKNMWLRLFRKYHDMYFLTYTNGTLIDRELAEALGALGNVAPALSIEGYREETDRRRGDGVYDRVLQAMEHLHDAGVLFGISVTYTSGNIETVTDPVFIRKFMERGIIFAWYFMFMPVGRDPILELVPSPEQRLYCGERIKELRREYPVFIADFWNDGPAAAGCLAGGRSYFHVLNSGKVEPCVFAHFGMDNIRETSLLEAVNSPFFKGIRSAFPYSDNGNLRRPCMIIDNPEVLREQVSRHLVPAGHTHSEDLINDEKVVKWIDDYALHFRKLVDPLWERDVADPENRWYREKDEYRNLFKFREHHKRDSEQVTG